MSIRDLINRADRWAEPAAARTGAAGLGFYDAARAAYRPAVVSTFAAASSAGATSTAPVYRNVSLSLAVGRSNELLEVPGRLVWFHDWSRTTDYLWVRFNDPAADRVKLRPGKLIAGISFERLYFSNDILTGSTAEILILPAAFEQLAAARA